MLINVLTFPPAAMFYGALAAISVSPMCMVAGIWQIAAGFIIIVVEVSETLSDLPRNLRNINSLTPGSLLLYVSRLRGLLRRDGGEEASLAEGCTIRCVSQIFWAGYDRILQLT